MIRRDGRIRFATPTTAIGIGVLTLLLMALDVPLEAAIHTLAAANAWELVFVVPFTLLGTIVARREPRNPMGWLLLAIPFVTVLAGIASDYAVFVYTHGHRGWPLGQLAVVLDSLGSAAGLIVVPMVILLFPDGRLERGWRWLPRAGGLLYCAYLVSHFSVAASALAKATPVWNWGGLVGANHPSGVAAWTATTKPILLLLFALFCIVAVAHPIVAYRGSTGVRRQQLKWLGAGGVISMVSLVATIFAGSAPTAVWVVIILGWTAVPLSMGVGILKYRLYEINRLISRTLAYALLTAMLVGTFIGLVALTTDAFALSGRVGVAASTLVAAALFNPLRVRIQRLVDRRFNRARYDAEATLAAFRLRLREAVELEAVRGELLDAVNRAVEPVHTSLWLRG